MEDFDWTDLTNQGTEAGKRLIVSKLADIELESRNIEEANA